MSSCRSCGQPLVVKFGDDKCVLCGHKKGLMQAADIAFTTRGAQEKAKRAGAPAPATTGGQGRQHL